MKKNAIRLFVLGLSMIAAGTTLSGQDTLRTAKFRAKMDSLKNTMAPAEQRTNTDSPALSSVTLEAQGKAEDSALRDYPVEKLLLMADSLRKGYDFPRSAEFYRLAIDRTADSLARIPIEEEMVLSENGISMMDFCYSPIIVAKQKFSIEDFFLFYPMEDNSWRAIPNQLDSLGTDPLVRATYIPEGASSLLYSAQDENGVRNLYRTHFQDSTWAAPELINEQLTSSSDECFPVLSADGKSLYFASKGLYGIGGYDLYVSTYNTESKDWSTPVNMGFPISSPFDDFLYFNTPDGKYSIFASNRECSKDSVYLYVMEYDGMPVRTKVGGVEDLRHLSSLQVQNNPARVDNSSMASGNNMQSVDTRRYAQKVEQIRILRDSITAVTNAGAADILTILPPMQKRLTEATAELKKIEMEFLSKGVVIDPDKIQTDSDREVVGAASGYTFTKMHMGKPISMVIDPSVPKHNFKIMDKGQFAELSAIPEGLVYQIQFISLSKKATVETIKGMSPVFERTSSGRFTYYAGMFRSYKEALANLNSVKKLGFKSAVIVAFKDGKSISVSSARSMEAKAVTLYKVRVFPEDGQSLSDKALEIIHSKTDKDIVKLQENGTTVYEIGPIDNGSAADSIAAELKAIGLSRVWVAEAGQSQN